MLKLLKGLLFITLPVLMILGLILEAVLRTVVPASNPPQGYFDESERVYKFKAEEATGMITVGPLAKHRARWRTNNHGWNSPVDYYTKKNRPRIAVIGDSYIAAFQVDVDKSYPALLGKDLSDQYDVYQFGVSGAPLSQYLHMSRYVKEVFSPDILIFNIVHNDFYESLISANPGNDRWMRLRIRGDQVEEVRPQGDRDIVQYSVVKRISRKSALVRYLIFNLRIRETLARLAGGIQSEPEYNANIDLSVLRATRAGVEKAVRYVLAQLKAENPETRIIFVMDASKNDIYSGREDADLTFLHELMAKYCRATGFEFLDLTRSMTETYELNGVPFNSEFDGHWNEYGHEFAYKQVSQWLAREQPNR
jgi:hypothetical protein